MHARLVAALSVLSVVLAQAVPAGTPACVTLCITAKFREHASLAPTCATLDVACYCSTGTFTRAYATCLMQQCTTIADASAGSSLIASICAAPAAASSSATAAGNSTASATGSANATAVGGGAAGATGSGAGNNSSATATSGAASSSSAGAGVAGGAGGAGASAANSSVPGAVPTTSGASPPTNISATVTLNGQTVILPGTQVLIGGQTTVVPIFSSGSVTTPGAVGFASPSQYIVPGALVTAGSTYLAPGLVTFFVSASAPTVVPGYLGAGAVAYSAAVVTAIGSMPTTVQAVDVTASSGETLLPGYQSSGGASLIPGALETSPSTAFGPGVAGYAAGSLTVVPAVQSGSTFVPGYTTLANGTPTTIFSTPAGFTPLDAVAAASGSPANGTMSSSGNATMSSSGSAAMSSATSSGAAGGGVVPVGGAGGSGATNTASMMTGTAAMSSSASSNANTMTSAPASATSGASSSGSGAIAAGEAAASSIIAKAQGSGATQLSAISAGLALIAGLFVCVL
ncbi:uncharacterized protein L969DRAFT_52099 [Mixia osmundae IAM 14324]|uniref:CFEM domain-containing protein n=1 Tax=Mixia osmundae (strain CBS 9802 / IAM 14324 / JCM 22182 / KY 12970) TaxID=764103 RepID=G7EAB7_MIXOS|nr:uncharacterized protein L969DRAFT_52099 [Mixia osmundae IAM 14324]KEI37836.1 hypothetical protein L969DRAFT_52099 [Mixia osmundae IAM 14324]GAA99777.1 hypothetical protein E5Q_06480 [Mixia osmundae IAM 14324]